MAIRIRVRLRRGEREAEVVALVNSGFETDTPDIVVPIALARRLGIWPITRGELVELETGGGEAEAFMVRSALELVSVDRPDKALEVNAIISRHVREVLISDYVAGELGIVALDFRRGLWRFSDEDVVRRSEPRPS